MSRDHKKAVIDAMAGFYRRVEQGKVEEPRPPKRKRAGGLTGPDEHDEQRTVVSWLRTCGIPIVAPVNGSRLSGSSRDRAIQWSKLVSLGASSGVPDLMLGPPAPMQPDKRVAVEMKRADGGKVSDAQREWHKALTACGWIVIVGHGATDAISKLQQLGYGAPL